MLNDQEDDIRESLRAKVSKALTTSTLRMEATECSYYRILVLYTDKRWCCSRAEQKSSPVLNGLISVAFSVFHFLFFFLFMEECIHLGNVMGNFTGMGDDVLYLSIGTMIEVPGSSW